MMSCVKVQAYTIEGLLVYLGTQVTPSTISTGHQNIPTPPCMDRWIGKALIGFLSSPEVSPITVQ